MHLGVYLAASRVRIDSPVCRNVTIWSLTAAAVAVWPAIVQAQTSALLDWRRIGGTVLDLSLASPAGGPVERVWYSADGARFFARTRSGRVWQTSGFESWQPATAEPPVRETAGPGPDGSVVATSVFRAARLYAAGRFAYRSEDGGLTWTNLTRHAGASILGGPLADAAVSPRNPEELVVAGQTGLWRSLDGGESWTGLNEAFPNLPVDRIVQSPGVSSSIRIAAGNGEFTWTPGERLAWTPAEDSLLAQERRTIAAASGALRVDITAASGSGEILYAGSAEGMLYSSRDRGANWSASGTVTGTGRIERIRVDPQDPTLAFAITQSGTRARVLRTSTGGVFWEDLTGNLPNSVALRGVAADRTSRAVYLATDRGVYMAYADSGAAAWTLLRAGAVTDVALDADGNQLYVSFADLGVFGALAPHRLRDPRVVSAADRVARAAAPGSLLSVIGARVNAARIGERVAPVLAASDSESQIQVPFDLSGDVAGSSLQLATESALGNRQIGLALLPASPSIFIDRDGVPLVMNADTGLVLDPATPARSGARIQILAAGLGGVQPAWPTGLAAPIENAPRVVAPVRAYLEREPVQVTRATLAPGYIGMYLVEVQLPSIVNRGPAELYIEAQDQQSNRIRIYLEP